MKYLDRLPYVASLDVEELKRKEATYKGSWKKRGGIGAFMMLARKWDRLESMCREKEWDIFKACAGPLDGGDGTAIAEIRDLRRYLLLVEAELMQGKEHVHKDGTPKEDSNKHAAATMDSGQQLDEDVDAAKSVLPAVHRSGS